MNRQRILPAALVAVTVARLIMIARTELSPAEAHAALCAEHAELWHPQCGPLLPVLMRLSMAVFGANEFGVRFFAPLLMLGAGWLVWRVAAGLFESSIAAWAAAFFQVVPLVNVASVTFTNTTLGIAESAGMLALLRLALHRPLRFQLHWWNVAALGVAALFTDWPLIMVAPAAAGSLLLTRRGRGALMRWPVTPVLAGALALALTVFLAWNSEHGWIAFHALRAGRGGTLGGMFVALAFGYGALLPILFGWSFKETALRRPLAYPTAFLYAFALPMFTLDVLAVSSTTWPQVGYGAWIAPACMLASFHLMNTERLVMRLKVLARSVIFLAAAMQSCFVVQARVAHAFGQEPWSQLAGWRAMAGAVRESLQRSGVTRGDFFIVTDRWDLAAEMGFYLRDVTPLRPSRQFPGVNVLPGPDGRDALDPWPRFYEGKYEPSFAAATLVYISDEDSRHIPPKFIRERWPQVRPVEISRIIHDGRALRVVKVFACSKGAAADK